jgi:hypothetical protein
MVSGRTTVEQGWSKLTDDVRRGPLGNRDGSAPNRRALKPLLRRLFPEFSVTALTLANNAIGETHDLAAIRDRIARSECWLRGVGQLLDGVRTELRDRHYVGGDDPVFTLVINESPAVGELLSGEEIPRWVAGICDQLTGREDKGIDALRRLFADPVKRTAFAEQLNAAWCLRVEDLPSGEAAAEYAEQLDRYLRSLGFESTSTPSVRSADGEAAWLAAAAIDAALPLLKNLPLFGLSAHVAPTRPDLTNRNEADDATASGADEPSLTLPLDQPIQRRLWSVLKGAAGRSWLPQLPELVVMAGLEIEGSARPLGLQTAQARAGLAAGARAYSAIVPDERVDELFDHEGAVGYLNRHVHSVLSMVGGFSKLGATAKNDLWDPGSILIPELWRTLHNAEYRLGTITEPSWVWGRIAGEVHGLLKEIQERFTKGRSGASSRDWRPGGKSRRHTNERPDAQVLERDARVRATIDHLRRTGGDEVLLDILRFRATSAEGAPSQGEVRLEWEAASAEASGDEGVEGASWRDLLGYLDDHLARA